MSNQVHEHLESVPVKHLSKEQCDAYDDKALIEQALHQVAFFACIYDRYRNRLIGYARHLGIRSTSEAEDVLQETFVKVWRNLNRFDPKLKFSNWLFRIMHNEAISHIRRRDVHRAVQDNATVNNKTDQLRIDNDVDSEANVFLQDEQVSEILDQLVLKYREVLVLKFLENMSYEEISDVLKIPEGTVATRINRAKKAFREIVNKKSHQNSLA